MWKFLEGRPGESNGRVEPPALQFRFPIPPHGPSDGSSRTSGDSNVLQRPVTEFDYDLWNLGWVDGRLGQPIKDNEEVLKAYANLSRQSETKRCKGRLTQLRSEIERDDELMYQMAQSLAQATKRSETVAEARVNRLGDHSLSLGLIFLLVGFLLFLSDIPLSLSLVTEGYDIPTSMDLNGHLLRVQEIFVNPFAVLQHLWEPLILALGIAFAGVFVKIFIEEVFLSPREGKRSFKILLSFIAVLFVVTLISVGIFRAERQKIKLPSEDPISSIDLGEPATSSGTETEAAPSKGIDWGFWSFLFLTLMLPVVGGLCFMTGWSRIQLWRFHQDCERQQAKQFQIYSALCAQRAGKKGELAALEEALLKPEQEIEPRVDLWKYLYRHGYWRGYAVPESLDNPKNLYSQLDKRLARDIAADARAHFWSEAETS